MVPLDPIWRGIHGWPRNDYRQLFEPNSPWQQVVSGINVFEFYRKFIAEAGDRELGKDIRYLQQRHIAIALQGTPLVASNKCGLGIEGYGPPLDMEREAERVQQLGGVIADIAFDEPLYYGHSFKGRHPLLPYQTRRPTPCRAAIDDLAQQAAGKISEVRRVFPDVKVGDIEPVGVYPSDAAAEFGADLAKWFDAYKRATGEPLAFVDLDVVWLQPGWPAQFDAAVGAAREAGIPFGVIYDGTPADPTDAAWISDARTHVDWVRQRLGASPERAIFQSWTDRPRQLLPETDPNTFTGLIRSYLSGQ